MNSFTVEELLRSALIFLRLSGILFFLPIFGDIPTPARVRVLMAGAMAYAFYHLIPVTPMPSYSLDIVGVGLLMTKEMLIGAMIGYFARLAFDAVIMAATLVGFQMGFGMANLFIPDANEQMTSFTALHRIIVMTIFLSLNLHFILIDAIVTCYEILPLGEMKLNAGLGNMLIETTAGIFVISLQLAAPVLVALLFTMAALGLAARAVPQLNIFVMSFPVSFFVGLLIYIATIPFFPGWMETHFNDTTQQLRTVVYAMKN